LSQSCDKLRLELKVDLHDAKQTLLSELEKQAEALQVIRDTSFVSEEDGKGDLLDTDADGTVDAVDFRSDREKKSDEKKKRARKQRVRALNGYRSSLSVIQKRILNLTNEAAKVATCQRILASLHFENLQDREAQIHEAYDKTFDWIFSDGASTFRQWLAGGESTFWICGKAGSGKSTLMKYLASHKTTSDLLQGWAGSERLVLAAHYFWSPGFEIQRSQTGLMQNLLFQILRQCPELIPIASQQRWEADARLLTKDHPWSQSELSSALGNILSQGKLTSRFCFFVDGLDEYSGDQYMLVRDLERLVDTKKVKLCVSSRPWNVFKPFYETKTDCMFALEDLTSRDMEIYVQGMLEQDDRFCALVEREPQANMLASHIRDRAEGVFLWVFLVVRSLLRGLNESDDTEELELRLAHMPTDLAAFFHRIINTIDTVYRSQTARSFQIAALAVPLPLIAFWYISLDLKYDPDSMMARIKPMTLREIENLCNTAGASVNKWCRDLLQVKRKRDRDTRLRIDTVNFLHRSVKEFLLTREMQDELSRQPVCVPSPRQTICRTYLAQSKALSGCATTDATLKDFHSSIDATLYWVRQCEIFEDETPNDVLYGVIKITEELKARNKHQHTWVHHPTELLPLAIRADLLCFVRRTLAADTQATVGILGHAILPEIIEQGRSTVLPITPSLEMVTLVLQEGADPNGEWASDSTNNKTVWQEFLVQCHNSQNPSLLPIAEVMLDYGADPDISVEVGLGIFFSRRDQRVTVYGIAECLRECGGYEAEALLEKSRSRKSLRSVGKSLTV
jgi:hypothetical protein